MLSGDLWEWQVFGKRRCYRNYGLGVFSVFVLLFAFNASVCGDTRVQNDWPGWRNDGTGVYLGEGGPEVDSRDPDNQPAWREVWRTGIPGRGVSSPIVSNGNVFVTTAAGGESFHSTRKANWLFLGICSAFAVLIALVQCLRLPKKQSNSINSIVQHYVLWTVALAFPLVLATSELLTDSENSWAKSLIGGSSARIWVVSGCATGLGIVCACLLAIRRRLMLSIGALCGITWAVILLSYIPDESNWFHWPTHIVEILIAAGGLVAGWLIDSKRWGKRTLAVSGGAVLVIAGAAVYWHITLHPIYCGFRLRFAVGLQGAFILCFVTLALRAAWQRSESINHLPQLGWISSYVLPSLLLVTAGVHFLCANVIIPRLGLLRMVVCLDAVSGQERWRYGFPTVQLERIVPATSYATPTPTSDGKRVFAYFGPAGILCMDHDGKKKWLTSHLPFKTDYGAATSPIVFEDQVIIVSDSFAGSFVAGIDSETGLIRWKTARPNSLDSYGTPLLYRSAEQTRIVVAGAGTLASYDPKTGKEIWIRGLGRKTNHVDSIVIQSPAMSGDTVFVGGDYRGQRLFAFKASEKEQTNIALEMWRTRKPVLGFPSPVVSSNLVFTVDNMGIASCISVDSGEIYWNERLEGSFAASPSVFKGRVIFLSEQGAILEVVPSPVFRIVAKHQTGLSVVGSPAFQGERIFVRTSDGICCLERKAISQRQ